MLVAVGGGARPPPAEDPPGGGAPRRGMGRLRAGAGEAVPFRVGMRRGEVEALAAEDLGWGMPEGLGILVLGAGGGGMSAEAVVGAGVVADVPLLVVFFDANDGGGGGGMSSAAPFGGSGTMLSCGGGVVVREGIVCWGGTPAEGERRVMGGHSGRTRLGTASSSLSVAEALGVVCSSSRVSYCGTTSLWLFFPDEFLAPSS